MSLYLETIILQDWNNSQNILSLFLKHNIFLLYLKQ